MKKIFAIVMMLLAVSVSADAASKMKLYVKDASGNWSEREFTVIGSYIAFDFTDGEQGFALQEKAGGINWRVIIVAVIATLVIRIIGVFVKSKKKKSEVK